MVIVLGFQTLILVVLLLQNRGKNHSFGWLSLLLGFFLLSLINYGLHYLMLAAERTAWIPYLQLELLYGFGPALYLYTKSLTDTGFRWRRSQLIHFVLPALELFYYRTSLFREGSLGLAERAETAGQFVFQVMQWGGMLSVLGYLVATLFLLLRYRRWLTQHYSNLERRALGWLERPVILYAAFWLLWLPTRILDIVVFADTLRGYYFHLGFLAAAALTCWVGFKGYLTAHSHPQGFLAEPSLSPPTIAPDPDLSAVAETLRQKMAAERYYLESDLTLATLAKRMGFPQKEISRALNSVLHLSFHAFVNTYRVEAFKENLTKKEFAHLNLLGVALESGFGSKSSFNLVFKATTGLTPKQYQDRQAQKKS